MAIRLRVRNGKCIALCAAKSRAIEGDVYLNDGMHGALSDKYMEDFNSMGFIKEEIYNKIHEL